MLQATTNLHLALSTAQQTNNIAKVIITNLSFYLLELILDQTDICVCILSLKEDDSDQRRPVPLLRDALPSDERRCGPGPIGQQIWQLCDWATGQRNSNHGFKVKKPDLVFADIVTRWPPTVREPKRNTRMNLSIL